MPIKIKPIKIKGTVYLLVPKDLAELLGLGKGTRVSLSMERRSVSQALVYSFDDQSSKENVRSETGNEANQKEAREDATTS